MKRLLFAVSLAFAAAPAFACSHTGGMDGFPVRQGFDFDDDFTGPVAPAEPAEPTATAAPTEAPATPAPTEAPATTPEPTITVTFTDANGTTQTTEVPESGATSPGEGSVVTEVVVAPPAPPAPPPPADVRLDDFVG